MLDTHFDYALEDCDGVFWHELLERNQECCLQSDAASYRSKRSGRIAHDGSPGDVDWHSDEVWDQCRNEHHLAKLFGTPCPFQVFAAEKDGRAIDEEGEDVLLDQGSRQEGPGIEDGDCRDER
jgi:hypothetical protein